MQELTCEGGDDKDKVSVMRSINNPLVLLTEFVEINQQTKVCINLRKGKYSALRSAQLFWVSVGFNLCCPVLSRVRHFATPWTAALQAPQSMGILKATTLEWVAMPSSRGSSRPGHRTQVSCMAGGFFII